MDEMIAEPTCHAQNCASAAQAVCMSCQQTYCSSHLRTVSLQRRGERIEESGHRGMLERVPLRTVTYTLCARCERKPIHVVP